LSGVASAAATEKAKTVAVSIDSWGVLLSNESRHSLHTAKEVKY